MKFLLTALSVSLFYILLNVYISNYQVINQAFLGDFTFEYRSALMFSLIQGLTTALSATSLIFLMIISVLTGLNSAMLIKKVNKGGGVHLMFGGSMLGTLGSGCVSCGLPLLGVLGMSGSIAYLPFKGLEFSVLSAGLLLISFYLLLRNSKKECVIKSS
ncbi:MAG: hypothetical protein ACD_30C00005G0036 [uncultured bacterium]|uniref:Uncharacterized protein n=4 Tax=Candidatus Daviesiibacteriota TaxID=1752718 RepID=A0A0G0ET81_9BACT|nr:MAG: hypothetical protein ACD_30C00005G0036 [uncultured bacterium]KKQ08732.1 MAG: hypothetical protein US19_C0020G0021 [Candidatus Daviesbacteria bacterium GW2011_GWB1_36_5]KKQ15888.1 MAG: hypothetical protein US28_C0008G0020 [Candidatus Daviesbacteria bacterium GW2011_GWA1_36_8]OGE16659.1 MAG: hypothetical protein A2858_02350 [Candidatus Daviesbacteria bacterium RIFCSPHIGHO2_01_FULL_36_37]OGE33390.1 MAG: hypothetical protein A3C99_01740 [Candidatus Daviesbacteria bacterium RIFCSPHIGHO2_02_F